MNVAKRTATATCPDCGENIDLGPQSREGQKVTCPECWAYLEVASLEPLVLTWDTLALEDDEDES